MGHAEFSAVPTRVLVHDPATSGALDRLASIPAGELKERCLFRAHPDPELFAAEHAALVAALRDAGVDVVHLDGVERNPNQVYTRDAAVTLPWLPRFYIRGAMRVPLRREEEDVVAAALEALGLECLFTPESFLEGGDVIPFSLEGRRALLVGFGPRTARPSLDLLWERLAPWALDALIGIRLADWRMNLDGALMPVADDTVVAQPESLVAAFVRDEAGERPTDVLGLMQELGLTVILVTADEATAMQACNVLCLGGRRVVCYDLCDRVVRLLRERDLSVQAIPGSELIKGTGGPRCMTRPVYA